MQSKNLNITNALRKHFDFVYHIRWGESTTYYMNVGKLHLVYEYANEDLEKYNPYDVVNNIWDDIYANFSEWA